MWHTSRGDRTLCGSEAKLVAQAVDTMVDALLVHVDDDLEAEGSRVCQSGIAVFDALSPSQRIGLLYDVTRHLLTDTVSTLALSATTEAAVAAIFIEIRDQVAIEIDLYPDGRPEQVPWEDGRSWRQLVLAACNVVLGDERDEIDGLQPEMKFPDPHCPDMVKWEDLVDWLAGAVLWDRDFEMAETFLDIDPGISRQRRRLLGIEDDYFTQVAPSPSSGSDEAGLQNPRHRTGPTPLKPAPLRGLSSFSESSRFVLPDPPPIATLPAPDWRWTPADLRTPK